jgi:hypothetical protein
MRRRGPVSLRILERDRMRIWKRFQMRGRRKERLPIVAAVAAR